MTDEEHRRAAIQAAVERLQRALAAVQAPPLGRQTNPGALRDVAAAVAPLRLPVEVEQFWTLVHGYSSTFTCFPHPRATDPDFALACWQDHRSQPGMTPDLLFPVCYESHAFLLAELEGPHGPGGACFTWAYGDVPFVLVAADLTAYLEVAAQTLESRRVGPDRYDATAFPNARDDWFREALREELRRAPHPTYGDAAEIGSDPASWPRHWLDSVGPAAKEQHARGVTTTIAALHAAGGASLSTGRVHAVVDELWWSADGIRATIDDGTGTIDVWCPAGVTMFGPACEGRYEFEIVTGTDLPHATQAEVLAVRVLTEES